VAVFIAVQDHVTRENLYTESIEEGTEYGRVREVAFRSEAIQRAVRLSHPCSFYRGASAPGTPAAKSWNPGESSTPFTITFDGWTETFASHKHWEIRLNALKQAYPEGHTITETHPSSIDLAALNVSGA
jgi:hypothetical protein